MRARRETNLVGGIDLHFIVRQGIPGLVQESYGEGTPGTTCDL